MDRDMLIIGCGYIGRALGARALLAGEPVTGVVFTLESSLQLRKIGIDPLALDLDQGVEQLPLEGVDRIYYFAPPPDTGVRDTRMGLFLGALRRHRCSPRIVYVSTTGVYGDCRGALVDESRPVQATTDRARRRLDAELKLLEWGLQGGGELVILRVAGIYGPGRLPLARLRQGLPMIRESEAPWSNRIHAEDLVTVCEAAMERGTDGEIYNVSDGTPGNMAEYYNKVADLAGLDRPPVISRAEAQEELPATMLSYLKESRRIDNRKMLHDLGVTLKYPTLKEGLPASLPKT
jgi:nucleoside-diphosphate-sugar epimerase